MEFIKGEQEEGISTEAAEILRRNDKTRQREKAKKRTHKGNENRL